MRKIIIVTISILLTLTFNFYAVNSLSIKSSTRAVTMNTDYSPLPDNSVIDNKHVTSYKNTGTVLEY
ncbi:hypothetical protein A8709_26395 [Paenibacillus pectinilyticus]|uniref:Uncharacterized protein n=1 Tax=Paenibacillus pectinilyticus TaxID=512399 RepID=A0A1C1A1G1_9BACL|nr:hypothetical protein A8709_26395 [Paenibacillus pectinilyticus]